MIRIFKRRRPEPAPVAPKISVQDTLVYRWFGLTEEDWNNMPAIAKVDKRESYAQAWRL